MYSNLILMLRAGLEIKNPLLLTCFGVRCTGGFDKSQGLSDWVVCYDFHVMCSTLVLVAVSKRLLKGTEHYNRKVREILPHTTLSENHRACLSALRTGGVLATPHHDQWLFREYLHPQSTVNLFSLVIGGSANHPVLTTLKPIHLLISTRYILPHIQNCNSAKCHIFYMTNDTVVNFNICYNIVIRAYLGLKS
jgi:hypothetical protein